MDELYAKDVGKKIAMDNILNFLASPNGADLPEWTDSETDQMTAMEAIRRALKREVNINKDTQYEIPKTKVEILERMYQVSRNQMKTGYVSFENWLRKWIWAPLSGDEHHLEIQYSGYFALSYVWNNHKEHPLLLMVGIKISKSSFLPQVYRLGNS